VPLSLSTLADQVGGCCAVLAPLIWRIERHVLAAERVHANRLGLAQHGPSCP
jgi:transposase